MQFKLEGTMFFRQDAKGHFRQLPINTLYEEILSADGANRIIRKMDGKDCVFIDNTMDVKSLAQ